MPESPGADERKSRSSASASESSLSLLDSLRERPSSFDTYSRSGRRPSVPFSLISSASSPRSALTLRSPAWSRSKRLSTWYDSYAEQMLRAVSTRCRRSDVTRRYFSTVARSEMIIAEFCSAFTRRSRRMSRPRSSSSIRPPFPRRGCSCTLAAFSFFSAFSVLTVSSAEKSMFSTALSRSCPARSPTPSCFTDVTLSNTG